MKKKLIVLIIAIVVLVLCYFLFVRRDEVKPVPVGYEEYSNEEIGISFEYRVEPSGYIPIENEVSGKEIFSLSLFDIGAYEELIASEDPREGPTAITVQVFERSPQTSLLEWLETEDASNYNLGGMDGRAIEASAVTGLSYNWSGLYEGRSIALPYADGVVILSVTYLTSNDTIINDYVEFLDSVELINEEKVSFETLTCADKVAGMFPERALEVPLYDGEIAEVDFDTYPEARAYQTMIRESATEGVNYGGHFNIAVWGCGTNCQGAAIVDMRTGEILPHALVAGYDFSYSPESRLLVSNPPEHFTDINDERLFQMASRFEREYFVVAEQDGDVSLERVCVENASKGLF